ncbi:transcriptional regulator GutM [Anaeromicrobium sediminis]|uniref:Transcriptional regulator n=1 Tax=Anaeromicrobium sediminis TaxID=1478221 RepID=A0A267MMS0_9FIRM|nr:transcriptional regulator GutM [Anaeromicrobium sediminis]PAB60218.1 hypothetical protein CCE28_04780 [Anaeromicrobium sediminis]
MNRITFLIMVGTIMWILQALFSFFQMRNFKNNFVEMRKKGRVAIGFNKGFFFSGIVVLIGIDDRAHIEEVRYMQGVTVLAKCKKLEGLEGKNLLSLKDEDLKDYNKLIVKAIGKAVENYEKHVGGGEKKIENLECEQLT